MCSFTLDFPRIGVVLRKNSFSEVLLKRIQKDSQ